MQLLFSLSLSPPEINYRIYHRRDKCVAAKREPVIPSTVPFCPLSESRSRTHLLPCQVRCCWTEPREPCCSDRRFCGFYHCCFFLPSRQRGGSWQTEPLSGREKKKSTSSQTRRGALCLLCNPKRRATGAEWLLLVFIGAY